MKRSLLLLLIFCSHNISAQNKILDSLQLTSIYNTACTPIKDQYLSATCWSFASNSFIESELIKSGIADIDLSEMFIARYSYLRKIKTHLAVKGTNFFTPGGQFHDVQWVINNYGMMPESAYPGKLSEQTKHDHGLLDTAIKRFIEKKLAAKGEKLSAADMVYINNLLDKNLGKVPTAFSYKGKRYTAKTFAKEYLRFNADNYVEITSYTHHPFYTLFVLEDKYNWTGDKYFNVPVNEFSAVIDSALAKGYTIEWDGDTQEAGFNYENGIAYVSNNFIDLQKERQASFEDHSTEIDHMMHIVGLSTDKDGNKWYKVKNSWGESNSLGGYLYMQEKYLLVKTGAIIVNKTVLNQSLKDKLK